MFHLIVLSFYCHLLIRQTKINIRKNNTSVIIKITINLLKQGYHFIFIRFFQTSSLGHHPFLELLINFRFIPYIRCRYNSHPYIGKSCSNLSLSSDLSPSKIAKTFLYPKSFKMVAILVILDAPPDPQPKKAPSKES